MNKTLETLDSQVLAIESCIEKLEKQRSKALRERVGAHNKSTELYRQLKDQREELRELKKERSELKRQNSFKAIALRDLSKANGKEIELAQLKPGEPTINLSNRINLLKAEGVTVRKKTIMNADGEKYVVLLGKLLA